MLKFKYLPSLLEVMDEKVHMQSAKLAGCPMPETTKILAGK